MLKKLLLPLVFCLLLAGCTPDGTVSSAPAVTEETQEFSTSIFAMDTVMDLKIFGDSQAPLDEAAGMITSLENALSTTDSGSEISVLNQTGQVSLSENSAFLMRRALELCKETDGALDISIYPVVRTWGFTTGSYRVPAQEELDALLEHVDYTKIEMDDNGVVTIPEGMQLDLGSIAKGYTGDMVCDYFRSQGITSALLNLGGNVQTVGLKPDGSPWRIGIQDPQDPGSYLGVLAVNDEAVITSGGYERFFEQDGQTYWHIIDPATGAPARSGVISATIVGKEGARCDALSTSLFIMGAEKAEQFWREHRDFDMILVTDDRTVIVTPGLEGRFELTENSGCTLNMLEP